MSFVENQLGKVNLKIDYIFSHTAPLKYELADVFSPYVAQESVDKLTEIWIDKIADKFNYEHWFLGHHHTDRCESRVSVIFEEIEEYQSLDEKTSIIFNYNIICFIVCIRHKKSSV